MEKDERLLHSSSFGAAAAAYAEHCPDYAQAAVCWALEHAPGPRVPGLGARTGKLTATPVALGADVIAVEPDPAMPTELRRSLPDVRALPGSAEVIPLSDASVDAVPAGHAVHGYRHRNVRPRSAVSAHTLRADPRPPRVSSRSRC
ncbi:class I SAM-dependent methyltransferase [Streptomyces sp. NRRL B-24720]|uniref:class I SAM-dependent methyltransferase n=1 Tax=Streptomyces sp. NRRL B-24720 TaxID=1476876 RepID=UPI001F22BC52|nr:methyltransferase domain-containing protein [Streptomyces sp. NRRL B-24720]